MTPQELINAACPKIGELGSAYYFHPDTLAKGKEHGLDGFRFYFLGRGGVLGDVESPVIAAAFGYFDKGLVAKLWDTAKERMAPRHAARLHLEACHDLGRAKLSGVAGLDAFNEAAGAVEAAADPTGLALYSGFSAEPMPDDAAAKALHLVAVLREFRGSAHLIAVIASGLDPAVAHAIRRPNDVKSFGYAETPPITDDDRTKLVAADVLTDKLVTSAFSVLDDKGATALVTGIQAIGAALAD